MGDEKVNPGMDELLAATVKTRNLRKLILRHPRLTHLRLDRNDLQTEQIGKLKHALTQNSKLYWCPTPSDDIWLLKQDTKDPKKLLEFENLEKEWMKTIRGTRYINYMRGADEF